MGAARATAAGGPGGGGPHVDLPGGGHERTDAAGSPAPFGTTFVRDMAVARFADGAWAAPELVPLAPLALHPGAHGLHYASSCFEGLKAHRGPDGVVRLFRLDDHVRRLCGSAEALVLPPPPSELVATMVRDLVRAALHEVPPPPGALYVRPLLLGTNADIGAAARPATEALLLVLASPVGDYFSGGLRPLSVAIETGHPRTTAAFGAVKAGLNYAMALGTTLAAARSYRTDQVLFAPGGDVQETGASNVLLLDRTTVVTPRPTAALLHGVTARSALRVAADLGYSVGERDLRVDDLLAWVRRPGAELALSGTAAVLAGVGTLVHAGEPVRVGDGQVGPTTRRLREALVAIQQGRQPDPAAWCTPVPPLPA